MAVKLITAAETYPVTLEEAKQHCRVDFDDDDAILEIYRKAATEAAESFTGRAFIDQTFDLYLDEFPEAEIKLPNSPLIEVEGVFYRDSTGSEQEIGAGTYVVDGVTELARVALADGASWPTAQEQANSVRVRYRAGYVNNDVSPVSGEVPFAIRAAILMTIGSLYANRETVVIGQTATLLPWAAEQLLRPYRVHVAIG